MIQRDTDKRIQCLREKVASAEGYAGIAAMFSEVYEYETAVPEYGIRIACPIGSAGAPDLPVAAERLDIDASQAVFFLNGLLSRLRSHAPDGQDELVRLQDAFATAPDLAHLFRSCFRRERQAIHEAAERIGVQASLLEFILEVPLRGALRAFAATVPAVAVESWEKTSCPVCTAPPSMAELTGEEGKKVLFCSTCSFQWPVKRLKCAFCGSENSDDLYYFVVGGSMRVDACRACSRYIKTRDCRVSPSDVPLDVEDILTIHVDMAAAREGLAGYR